MKNNLTIAQIKIIVNNCEEHTIRQIAKMPGLDIDPTIVYHFLLHIGINKPFGGEDFLNKTIERKPYKKKSQLHIEEQKKEFVRPKAKYTNEGYQSLLEKYAST